jgi:D-threo-aldose 1-dehydrogenase
MADLPANDLGQTGLKTPVLGFGGAPIARHAATLEAQQGRAAAEDAAHKTIRHALAQGIRLFDTAPLYGSGRSEQLVGAALAGVPRGDYLLSTKVGRVLTEGSSQVGFDFSRDGVLRSLEGSLARLQTDCIDILHIHDPDDHMEQAIQETLPTLAELRRQGVIRAVSAGMNQWQALDRFGEHGGFDCFLLAGRYTLLEQGALGFLDRCRQRGIGVLLGGVFNSGILATGAVPGALYQYREASPEIRKRTAAIEAICRRYGVSLPAAALQFAQAHPAVASLVVGAVSPMEVSANLAALKESIPGDLWGELKQDRLLDEAAPVP